MLGDGEGNLEGVVEEEEDGDQLQPQTTCSAGTVARSTNLILVSFPRIRKQSEPTPCRLSQATVRNLDKFIFIVKGNVLPFSLAQFLERWQLGTFFFSIL